MVQWCVHPKKILWQVECSEDIQENLVMAENPPGSITINNLELVGMVLNSLILESLHLDLVYCHLATYFDNMATVIWEYNLYNSRLIITGYLLKFLGLKYTRP